MEEYLRWLLWPQDNGKIKKGHSYIVSRSSGYTSECYFYDGNFVEYHGNKIFNNPHKYVKLETVVKVLNSIDLYLSDWEFSDLLEVKYANIAKVNHVE